MKTEIPFRWGERWPEADRILIIERDEGTIPKGDCEALVLDGFDVNISIKTKTEGRRQVIVDVRAVLSALQKAFPKLGITFKGDDSPDGHRVEA